jgi:D-sedoheptulose 7-phosphate isomerase
MQNLITATLQATADNLTKLQTEADTIAQIGQALVEALRKGNKLITMGNGGSGSDAMHIVSELVSQLYASRSRRALPAIALTANPAVLTAIGNDFGYENVFVRQVQAHMQAGDIVMGMSSSGNSENVVRALQWAREHGGTTVALTGSTGGRMPAGAEHGHAARAGVPPRGRAYSV